MVNKQRQLEMFSPVPPRVPGCDTSEQAAESVASHTATLRWKVYHLIKSSGAAGMTCDEAEGALDLRHQTVSARVNELHRGGFIVDSDQRRKTRSGRNAIVWVAKETTP